MTQRILIFTQIFFASTAYAQVLMGIDVLLRDGFQDLNGARVGLAVTIVFVV